MIHRYAEFWSPHFAISLPRAVVEQFPAAWLNERMNFWDRLCWLHDELGGYHHLKIPRRVDVDVQLNANVQAWTGYPFRADPYGNRMLDSHTKGAVKFWYVGMHRCVIT